MSSQRAVPAVQGPSGRSNTTVEHAPDLPLRRTAVGVTMPDRAIPAAPGEVHVWLLESASMEPDVQAAAVTLMSPGERDRAARFVREADRLTCLAARALARTVLPRYAPYAAAPRDVVFTSNRHGKPALSAPGADGVFFNLSHTRGLTVLAVSRTGEIGVDVESVRDAPLDVASRYFAAPEVALLERSTPAERSDVFFRLWTLKESFIKACGGGLSIPLASFAVGLSPPRLLDYGPMSSARLEWDLVDFEPAAGVRGAVCVRRIPGCPPDVIFRRLDPRAIVVAAGSAGGPAG